MFKFIKNIFKKKERVQAKESIVINHKLPEKKDAPEYKFPDISHYEPCDFDKFNGHDLIFKATEGIGMVDPTLYTNMRKCEEKSIRMGVYHFYRCDKDPIFQAKHFIGTVGKNRLITMHHPPIVDYEESVNIVQTRYDLKKSIPSLVIFMEYVYEQTGKHPILYSNQSLIQFLDFGVEMTKHPLWIAKYGDRPTEFLPWTKYWAWQYTASEKFQGIGKCDGNYFLQ